MKDSSIKDKITFWKIQRDQRYSVGNYLQKNKLILRIFKLNNSLNYFREDTFPKSVTKIRVYIF